jgi:hypothetical protein
MTQMPDGAQLSPDGNYWLDTTSNEWKPVPTNAATATAGANTGADAAGGDPRVQARVTAGIAPEVHAATDEQRAQYIGDSTIGHESLEYTTLEVPEIADEHQGAEHEGQEHEGHEGELA